MRLRAGGMSILYTTHYMEEAERLCDRIGIIDEGRILAEGTRRELVDLVGQLDRVTLTATGDAAGRDGRPEAHRARPGRHRRGRRHRDHGRGCPHAPAGAHQQRG